MERINSTPDQPAAHGPPVMVQDLPLLRARRHLAHIRWTELMMIRLMVRAGQAKTVHF
jgi:hypothetical protein